MITGKLAQAVFELAVDGTKFAAGLNQAEATAKARLESITRGFSALRNVAVIGFGMGVAAIKSFSDAAMEAEAQTNRFKSSFQLLGQTFAAQIPRAEAWAESLKKTTDFDDEDLLEGLGRVTALTKDVSQGMLAMEAATDLARLKGIGLAEAQQLVIMAYNGQTRGIKKLIGDLGEGVKGHAALIEIQKRVAGGAEATAGTVERSQERMKLAWEDAKEKLGKDLQPTLIKLYGILGDLAGSLEGVSGQTILYTTAALGATAAAAQGVIWYANLRTALLTLTASQAAATAGNFGFINSLKAIPPQAAIAVAALTALVAQYNAVAQKAREFNQQQGRNAGGDGTGNMIKTTNDRGDIIYQSSADIAAESQIGGWELWMANFFGNYAGKFGEEAKRIEQAQNSIQMLRDQQVRSQMGSPIRQYNSPTEDVKSQIAAMI